MYIYNQIYIIAKQNNFMINNSLLFQWNLSMFLLYIKQ